MKLPLETSSRYKVLLAFKRHAYNVEDLIANCGLFGVKRERLNDILWELEREGLLQRDLKKVYSMPALVKIKLPQDTATTVATRRDYNVYAQPPITAKHIPSCEPRRPNCLSVSIDRRYTTEISPEPTLRAAK